MPELLVAQGGVCRNFCVLKEGYGVSGSGRGMPELLWAQGGYAESLRGLGGVCRNLCGLRGGMPELLWAWGGYAGTVGDLGGGVSRNFWGLKGG